MNGTFNLHQAIQIYDVLTRLGGARKEDADAFFLHLTEKSPGREWRFRGHFGFGGKFRTHTVQIDMYPEDQTQDRLAKAKLVNDALSELQKSWATHGVEPQTREDIERILAVLLSFEEVETGLFKAGVDYVVVDRVDQSDGTQKVTFNWFESLEPADFRNEDPHTQEDIEAWFQKSLQNNEVETGLYDVGLSKLVVDRVDSEIVFTWFDNVESFDVALAGWRS